MKKSEMARLLVETKDISMDIYNYIRPAVWKNEIHTCEINGHHIVFTKLSEQLNDMMGKLNRMEETP